MALQLAPYNNAMRLGQGFNSYTQQICLNGAVLQPSKIPVRPPPNQPIMTPNAPAGVLGENSGTTVATMDAAAPAPAQLEVSGANGAGATKSWGERFNEPQGVSQIVSYSSRFVDKLSDLTDAMNISASLSIKTATVGGKASGSFVDSDKFKESDMNFFVQVKVVNQVIVGEDFVEFQNLKVPKDKFTEVYGDTYISGFEKGGELNALISVKVSDKNKTFAVRAELEASLGTPALSGEVKGGVNLEKSKIETSTETTVTVNWSGGGQIKPTDAIWDVNTLTLAAANFPDLVAKTPQCTYAILGKYTSLKSFRACYPPESVLAYENAGVYTSALLDMYMDYKAIWKQIQLANFELKNRRADMKIAKPSYEVTLLAEQQKSDSAKLALNNGKSGNKDTQDVKAFTNGVAATGSPAAVRGNEAASAENHGKKEEAQIVIPNMIDFTPYPATVLGMDKARRDCRNEMIKIIDEVDQVTLKPALALDPRREDRFVSPRVFTQLLPVVSLRPVETADPKSNMNPQNLVILGETSEVPKLLQWLYNRASREDAPQPYPAMLASLDRHKSKSKIFDMGDTWCGVLDPGKTTIFFNDLDLIDDAFEPKVLSIWVRDDLIIGLKTFYSNGKESQHGDCVGSPSNAIDIQGENSHSVIQLVLEAAEPPNSSARVRGLQVTFDSCKSHEFPALDRVVPTHRNVTKTTLTQPTNGRWSFRGLWGSLAPYQGGFLTLGAVWGQDKPETAQKAVSDSTTSGSSGPDYTMFIGRSLPDDAIATANQFRDKAGKYSMSLSFGEQDIKAEGMTYFNDLELLQDPWRIKSLTFYVDKKLYISGYTIEFKPNGQVKRGGCQGEAVTGKITGDDDKWTSVKLESAKYKDTTQKVISSVLLKDILETKKAFVAKDSELEDNTTIVCPESGWFLRGFWGYHTKDAIHQLGVIWGRN